MRHITLLAILTTTLPVLAQPANDQCSAVTPVALEVGSTLTLTGTRSGATTTNDGVSGSTLMTTPGVSTVWEAFTTTGCSNVTARFCGTAGAPTAMWNFLTADCPADQPIYFSYANFGILCPNGQFGIQWFNLPAGTYYLPIYCTAAGGAYSLQLSAEACIPGPANDECTGAVPLAVNTTCTPTNGTVQNGTLSAPANECNGAIGDANDDVWFSFVATSADQTITVDGNGDLDAVVEMYGGSCGNTTLLACSDATFDGGVETIALDGYIPGNTYFVRVFHYYTAFALNPTFTICVTGDLSTAVAENTVRSAQVYPNPTHGAVTIEGTTALNLLVVRDATGRIVAQQRGIGERTLMDLNGLPSGTYTIEVHAPDGALRRSSVLKL
jgi:hypothetical protein